MHELLPVNAGGQDSSRGNNIVRLGCRTHHFVYRENWTVVI